MNLRLRIPLVILIGAAVIFPLLMLLTSLHSNTLERKWFEHEVECACPNVSAAPREKNVSDLERRLAQYDDMLTNSPYTFYPLYLPDFRELVQRRRLVTHKNKLL